jgi:hypothetical protein
MLSMTKISDHNCILKTYVSVFQLYRAIFSCLGGTHGLFVHMYDQHNGCDSANGFVYKCKLNIT